jgi:hypothetical protein
LVELLHDPRVPIELRERMRERIGYLLLSAVAGQVADLELRELRVDIDEAARYADQPVSQSQGKQRNPLVTFGAVAGAFLLGFIFGSR